MRLESITIDGFKSFAKKTRVDFSEGLTGIVGPNGSGKSNFIEALRWTLGEQSVKNLRGSAMTDLIFAGTNNRPAAKHAEVSLEFDNSDGLLDGTEKLTVSRKIDANGENKFKINNKPVRLKDVTNLFLDSGLGRNSFSIISQGKVEEIFNAKPEDRRFFIEEIAGVLKYKQKQHETSLNLKRTKENLTRINDIKGSIHSQVVSLHEQSVIAQDYLRYQEKYKHNDIALTVNELTKLVDERQGIEKSLKKEQQKLQQLAGNLKQADVEMEDLNHEFAETKTELTNVTKQLFENNELYHDLKSQSGLMDYQINDAAQKVSESKTNLKKLNIEKDEYETKILALTNKQAELAKEKTDLISKKTSLSDQLANNTIQINHEIDRIQSEYISDLQSEAQTTTEINNGKKRIEILKNQLNDLLSNNDFDAEKLTQDVDKKQEQLKNNKSEIEKLEHKLKLKITELNVQKNLHEQMLNEQIEQERKLSLANLKKENIEQQIENHQDLFAGTRNALQFKSKIAGIHGAVVDLIDVPGRYKLAADIALGNRLQNLIVDNDTTAKKLINQMKRNSLGRITVIPNDNVNPRFLNSNLQKDLSKIFGYIGPLAELISFPSEIENSISFLMGTTIVTKDLTSAVEVSKVVNKRFPVVTIDGEIINAGGAITGGKQRDAKSGLLKRRDEFDSTKKIIEDLEKRINSVESKISATVKNAQAINNEIQSLEQQIQEAKAIEWQNKQELSQVQQELQGLIKQSQVKAIRIKNQENEIKEVRTDIEKHEITLSQIQVDKQKHSDHLIDLKKELSSSDANKVKFNDLLNDTNIKLAEINQLGISINDKLNVQQVALSKVKESITLTQNKISQLETLLLEQKNTVDSQGKEIKTLNDSRKQADRRKQDLTSKLTNLENEINQRNNDNHASWQKRDELNGIVSELTVKFEKLNYKINNLILVLKEKYHFTQFDIEGYELPGDFDEAESTKQRRLAKLGLDDINDVNIGSIKDYEEIKQRDDFLDAQINDLTESIEQLNKTITKLNLTVSIRFKETFDAVNKSFQEVFPKMFGGGYSQLVLTDEDDILNTGIEIIAQPPGKKLQKISLLSGGEKALTVISLLFAIIKVKPVPFCILDEVEASLDDANVDRFANFMKEVHQDTQFIVITHRKGTMESADVLFGITMQTPGVSQLLSVNLDTVMKEGK